MQIQRNSLHFLRISFDIILLTISFIAAAYFANVHFPDKTQVDEFFLYFALLSVWFFSSKSTALYDEFRSRNFSFELITVCKNVAVQAVSAVILIFFIKEAQLSRTFVVLYTIILTVSLSLEKYT
ncbi:MAG: hypothetical protein ACM34K_17000, partial [Bacillota bacterium]